MLIITDNPFNLIKYHVKNNNDLPLKVIYTSNVKDVTDSLIQSVAYTKEGDLTLPLFLIKYDGKQSFRDFEYSSNTIVYLVVKDLKPWLHFKARCFSEDKVRFLDVKPSQYKYKIAGVEAVLEPAAVGYFWSEYCIKKFDSNPEKWYNEVRYLMCRFAETKKKFSCSDLDCIYNKVSDTAKEYLKYIYTEQGKQYIKQMTPNELFMVFVAPPGRKSLFFRNIEKNKPTFLNTYMIFKEAVMAAKIRIKEAVYILDYLLNKETTQTIKTIRNLFNLR